MLSIDNILVPVDFSPFSRAALACARNLGGQPPHVQLVHVIERWPPYVRRVLFPYAPLGEDDVEFEHELRLEAEAALRKHLKLEDELPEWIDSLTVELGNVKEALPQAARSTTADLVVMGGFGESGVMPDALGSNAERMVRSIRQPTLMVRGYDPSPKIKKIVVAVDLGAATHRVYEAVVGLALHVGAEVETVFVIPDPLAHDTDQVLQSVLQFDRRKTINRSRDRIEALFDRATKNLDVPYSHREDVAALLRRRKVVLGDPARAIVAYASEADADLVVVGSQDTSRKDTTRLGSVAWAVARRCPLHVMVVPVDPIVAMADD